MSGRTTYQKRQKEMARQEKQREKMAKRAQRKEERLNPTPEGQDPDAIEPLESTDIDELTVIMGPAGAIVTTGAAVQANNAKEKAKAEQSAVEESSKD